MNITDKLDEFDALAAAATKGPWAVAYEAPEGEYASGPPYAYAIEGPANHSVLSSDWLSIAYKERYGHQMTEVVGISDADATFIAAARTTFPALVKALRAVVDPDLVESAEWLGEMRTFTGEHAEDPGNRAYMAYIERVLTAAGAVQRDGFRWGPICLAIILDRHVRETEKAIAITEALGGAA